MADLIQKSVRLPEELFDYVEQQDGRDFSKRLVNLLMDIKDGDAQRKEYLDSYDRAIKSRREELQKLGQYVHDVQRVIRDLEIIARQVTYITSYLPEKKPPDPTPADP